MNDCFWEQILIVLIVAAIGYWTAHKLKKTERRGELITNFLLSAYQEVEFGSNRKNIINKDAFEKAIASINLLGTPEQIELVHKFTSGMQKADTASPDCTQLLRLLRSDLRKELGLAKVKEDFIFFRFVE